MNIHLEFPHDYKVELDHSLSGRESEPVFYFPGGSQEGGRDGVMVKIMPDHGKSWFGVFSGIGEGVYGWPDGKSLCVVAGHTAYLGQADDPHSWTIVMKDVLQTLQVPEMNLTIFVSYMNIAAYRANEIFWETERIGFGDDLKILDIKNGWAHGQYYDPTNRDKPIVDFQLDLEVGRLAPHQS